MTDTVREKFEAIYGPRNGSSMSVAQWDVRSQVWDKAFEAGRESMREDAIKACEKVSWNDETSVETCIERIKEIP